MSYAHFWHVDGEAGDVDYELIFESRDGFQLTHHELRETHDGDAIAVFKGGYWFFVEDDRPFSDVTFSDEFPKSIVMKGVFTD